MTCSSLRRLPGIFAISSLLTVFALAPAAANSVDLTVSYSISVSGLPVGKATVDAKLEDGEYTISGSGGVAGISAVFSDGKGDVSVTGTLRGQKISPVRYSQTIVEDEKETLDMTFSEGRVSDVVVTPSKGEKQTQHRKKRNKKKKTGLQEIPLEDEHYEGVLDPLSAFLIPVESLDGESVCQRELPLFDGEQRFNIVMTLKKVAKRNGARVFICSLAYRPVAGYKPEKKSVKFMVNNKKMEVWLAPAGSSGLVVPIEAYVKTEIGMLVVKATNFKLRQ